MFGWRLYALFAVVLLIGGLSLTSYAFYQKARAESIRADEAQHRAEQLADHLRQSEAEKQKLLELSALLDKQLVERDRRARELETAKRNLARELDDLKSTLPKEDQDCLDRPLPDGLVSRLRD